MNIKFRMAVLVALCTVTGFIFGSTLVYGYQDVQTQTMATGPNSGALKDAGRLEDLLGQWLLLSDLILNDGETHVLSASDRQSSELASLLNDLKTTPLAADKTDTLAAIEHGIETIQQIVADSTVIPSAERADRMNAIVAEVDALAAPVVESVESLHRQLNERSRRLQNDLEDRRQSLGRLSILFAVLYSIIVVLAWSWTVRTTVRPIEELSLAAECANLTRAEFDVEEEGPAEVRRLNRNISAFVSRLEASRDATEKEVVERTAQLVKANHAKSEFLATMSHELRTPLNGIISMNALMLDTQLDHEQVEYASTAKSAAEALLGIINDILDFSKIEAKKLTIERVSFDVREVVESTMDIISGLAESKGLEIATIVAHNVPARVLGDPTRVRQVLMNLLNNAIKFTEAGRVVVRVTQPFSRDNSDSILRFEVSDTGIGIAADTKDTLFQVFEQADSSTTRRFGGTGLGLAISKELAQAMGGNIGVESEFGVGSCFWFTVQVECCSEAQSLLLAGHGLARKVVVFSDRDLIREQVGEALLSVGIDSDSLAIFGTKRDISAIPDDFLEPDVCLFAIVDSDGQPAHAKSMYEELAKLDAKPRVGVIEHLLRRTGSDLEFVDADRLLEPLKTRQLRDWIAASDSAVASRAKGGFGRDEQSGTILVVEDNVINQKVARKVLERAGFTVAMASDGREAIVFVREHACDLILMDCQMPVMDGWQSTRIIRELETAGKLAKGCPPRLPIVACTANAQDADRRRCIECGMDDFVSKPFKLENLIDTIRKRMTEFAPTVGS